MDKPSAGYVLLDHPADLGIEAFGKDLAGAFVQAAFALMSVILDPQKIDCTQSRAIVLEGVDREHLLVKWLTEVLYLYDGQGFAAGHFVISELSSTGLKATLTGEPFDAIKHAPRLDVKAITYHQLLVEETAEGTKVRVFLDI
jgi:SHS2 domain-containing protein